MTVASRGDDDEEYERVEERKGHWQLTFGCPPNKTTPAASTLVHELFAHLKQQKKTNGSFVIPGALKRF